MKPIIDLKYLRINKKEQDLKLKSINSSIIKILTKSSFHKQGIAGKRDLVKANLMIKPKLISYKLNI
jgi:hypothetical protein